MPRHIGLDQMMRQHRHRQTRGPADLHGVSVSRPNAEMLGEYGGEHDVRRDSAVAAEDAVDLAAPEAAIGNRKRRRLAHEVERGTALVPAECRQPDAVDEAHDDTASRKLVIPGCALRSAIADLRRKPGISRFRGRIFDAPRNDDLEFPRFIISTNLNTTSASPAPSWLSVGAKSMRLNPSEPSAGLVTPSRTRAAISSAEKPASCKIS